MGLWFWKWLILHNHILVINSTIKGIITALPLNIKFITFLYYLFYSKICWICFLQFLLIKRSSNSIFIKDLYIICPRHSIFNLFNHENCSRPIWSVNFSKNGVILTFSSTLNLGSFLLFSTSKSIYVLEFTSKSFIFVVLCKLIYQYTHFSILKSYICKFCYVRL